MKIEIVNSGHSEAPHFLLKAESACDEYVIRQFYNAIFDKDNGLAILNVGGTLGHTYQSTLIGWRNIKGMGKHIKKFWKKKK